MPDLGPDEEKIFEKELAILICKVDNPRSRAFSAVVGAALNTELLMFVFTPNRRRPLRSRSTSLFAAAALLSLMAAGQVNASILQVDLLASANSFASASDQAGESGSSTQAGSPASTDDSPQSPNPYPKYSPQQVFHPTAPSGGTSSSSSVSGGNHTGVTPWMSGGPLTSGEDTTSSRLVLDDSLSLPMPPGVDLFRPPCQG